MSNYGDNRQGADINTTNTILTMALKISDLSVGDWVQDKNGIYAKVLGLENWSNGYFLNIEICGVNVGVTPLASARTPPRRGR